MQLCLRENTIFPLVVLGVVAVLVSGLFIGLSWNKARRTGVLVAVGLSSFLMLVAAGVTRGATKDFDSYAVGPTTVTLGYAWPRGDVTLPLASLRHVNVNREQWVSHAKSGAGVYEHGWVLVEATEPYRSCETAPYEHLAAAGKALAAAIKAQPTWELECADGHRVTTTEQIIGTPHALGGETFKSLCGRAKTPASFR